MISPPVISNLSNVIVPVSALNIKSSLLCIVSILLPVDADGNLCARVNSGVTYTPGVSED